MTKNGIKNYFMRHQEQLQIVLFLLFSFMACIAQLVSRLVCDLLFQNIRQTVSIWPFPNQALGSLLAFLISNCIAKALSYILNRKKTFNADNNALFSIIGYIVMVVLLVLAETIIGTPLQNSLYGLFGGHYTGVALTTASAQNDALYQICGTLSQMIYGAVDSVIIFVVDKYVLMRKTGGKSAETDTQIAKK